MTAKAASTILVVDDYSDNRTLLSAWLRAKGFKVVEASDGKEGVLQANRSNPDLILMDLAMPELDGVEMMRCIRSVNPNVRALYMSGATIKYQAALDRERKEFDARVLAKPFSRHALLHEIVD